MNKRFFKGFLIILIYIMVAVQLNFREIKANPAVATLTTEGLEAFLTFLSATGIEVSNIKLDNGLTQDEYDALSDDDKTKYCYHDTLNDKYYTFSDTKIGQAYRYEYTPYFNEVGANKTNDGFFDFYQDGIDTIDTWVSDFFTAFFDSSSSSSGSDVEFSTTAKFDYTICGSPNTNANKAYTVQNYSGDNLFFIAVNNPASCSTTIIVVSDSLDPSVLDYSKPYSINGAYIVFEGSRPGGYFSARQTAFRSVPDTDYFYYVYGFADNDGLVASGFDYITAYVGDDLVTLIFYLLLKQIF